ncbi:proline iminopeptidase [Reticulibacter mediterranei]|uniref:prolyl aminopeptidase n=1 Tax=Reticulibacter mediterranei TaxID=2778369 RepID=A0A8J3MX38_9CHLR|nr:alpha/beta hydrolase [Reticulibacter mediterranei]GHO90534.1 proline iminopeptidase [Reticulibacter mediterranei]
MGINIFTALITRKSNQHKLAKNLVIATPNSIMKEGFVRIGGMDQWLTIRGEDRNNPVILFVHGGPGTSYTIFTPLLRVWEKYFTIIQWDQPGSGKTLRTTDKTTILTFERIISDGIEVAEFLCKDLDQKKIILVGSSLGSIISTTMIKRRPDLFWAYIGTDHTTGSDTDELSYQLILDLLRAAGNTKGVKAVEKIEPAPIRQTRKEHDQLLQWRIKANPMSQNMVTDIILPAMLTSPNHTLRDLINYFQGIRISTDQLFNELVTINLRKLGMLFEVPFFIFQGETDVVTPTTSAKAYFDELEAPHKEFVLIKQAGHLAAFAQPEQFLNELQQRVRPLVIRQMQKR